MSQKINRSDKNKIIHVVPDLGVGGVQTVVNQIYSNSSFKNHFILPLNKNKTITYSFNSFFERNRVLTFSCPKIKSKYFYRPIKTLNKLIQALWFFYASISLKLRFSKSTIIHLHITDPFSHIIFKYFSSHLFQKVNITVHGFVFIKPHIFFYNRLLKFCLGGEKKNVTFTVVAKHLKNKILDSYPYVNNCEVIRNGVDLKKSNTIYFKNNKQKTEPLVIATIGRLSKEKGFDTLIKALLDIEIEFRCIIIGGGEEYSSLLKLSLQKKNLLSSMAVKLILFHFIRGRYIHSTFKRENFGISTLEAMAHGLPVITSDAPGLVELISGQKYGLSFTNNDTNDLSEKIKRLHYDRSLLEKFSLLSLNRSKRL